MMKKILALLLALCMVFSLCACGGNGDTKEDEKNNNVVNNEVNNEVNDDDSEDESKDETNEDEGAQTKAAFQVKVVDEGGNPVEGVMVQICKDACIPSRTDANGIASFSIPIEDGHKLSVMSAPEGYEYSTEEIYLEAGASEYTITIKAVQ